MKRLLLILMSFTLIFSVSACAGGAGSGNITGLSGLKGKVVYNIGQAQPPDYVLRYVLKKNGIEYVFSDKPAEGKVALSYAQTGTTVAGLLEAGKADYGIIAEPDATAAADKIKNGKIMLDLQQLYSAASGYEGGYPQACLVVKKSFLEAHPRYVEDFINSIKTGGEWVENNPAAAVKAASSAGSTTLGTLSKESAERCNIGFLDSSSAREMTNDYFLSIKEVLGEGEADPFTTLPDDGFYAAPVSGAAAETGISARVYAPDGAPALALAQMISAQALGAQYNIVAPSQIGAMVAKNADIAIMPSNAAAVQYVKTGAVVMLGVVTFGNLYLLGKTA